MTHQQVLELARKAGAFSVVGNWEDEAIAEYDNFLRTGELSKTAKKRQPWIAEMQDHPGDLEYIKSFPFSNALPELGIVVAHAGGGGVGSLDRIHWTPPETPWNEPPWTPTGPSLLGGHYWGVPMAKGVPMASSWGRDGVCV